MPKKKKRHIRSGINYGTTVLTWRAPEYQEHERGQRWIMTASVGAMIMIAWAIWSDTYTFAAVVILLAGLYFLTHRDKPKDVDISLTTSGILSENQFFPYTNMKEFWILYDPDSNLKTLNISLKSGLVRETTFQLGPQDPMEIRSFLSAHVNELEGRGETIIEKIIRILKL